MTCYLDENSIKSEIDTAVVILEYCLITCIEDVQYHISSLGNIPKTKDFAKINNFLLKSLGAKSFLDRITSMVVFLEHDNMMILTNTLLGIKSLLLENEALVLQKLSGENIEQEFSNLFLKLLDVIRKHSDQSTIKSLVYECIGILGAVDPFKLMLKDDMNAATGKYNFAVTDTVLDFTLFILVRQLVPEYSGASNIQTQSLLAYTIQELLKFIGFSKHSAEQIKTSDRYGLSIKDDALKSRWDSVPKKYIPILFPLLSSKYSLKDKKQNSSKILLELSDLSTLSINLWLKQLYLRIIGRISERNDFYAFFHLLKDLILDTDISVADHILPCAVMNAIIDDNASAELIKNEFANIIIAQADVAKIRVGNILFFDLTRLYFG